MIWTDQLVDAENNAFPEDFQILVAEESRVVQKKMMKVRQFVTKDFSAQVYVFSKGNLRFCGQTDSPQDKSDDVAWL